MAIIGKKLAELMVHKFNEEYQATHKPNEFILEKIPLSEDYSSAYQLRASIGSKTIRFRVYFDAGTVTNLYTYKLNSVDDTLPQEDYCFTSKGTIDILSITDNGATSDLIAYRGSGQLDVTNVCYTIRISLFADEW